MKQCENEIDEVVWVIAKSVFFFQNVNYQNRFALPGGEFPAAAACPQQEWDPSRPADPTKQTNLWEKRKRSSVQIKPEHIIGVMHTQ